MQKYNIKISKIFFLTYFLTQPFFNANASDNFARIFLVLQKNTFLNPEIITFDLKLDSTVTDINALDIRLNFNPNALELINTDASSSICNFIINETINNKNGKYQLLCGTEKKEIDGNNISTLTFKKIKPGFTQIYTSADSQILQNDGLGTYLETINETHNIFIYK